MKKIFITGASSGIGKALAQAYAAQSTNEEKLALGLAGRNTAALQQLADRLQQQDGITCTTYTLDVRKADALQQAATDFIERFGAPNIVIANAGVSRGTLTEYQEDIAAFQAIMDINVMGLVHTFQPFIAAMHQSTESSQLVGIASVAGIRGLPGGGAYSASKSAAMTYLESLRVEMQPYNINVTTIAPGYIRSPMTDINQYKMPFLLEVEDFAKQCIHAIEKRRRFKIIPWQMAWVARLMRLIPPCIWDRLTRTAPHKARTKWDWLDKDKS